jgi:Hint module
MALSRVVDNSKSLFGFEVADRVCGSAPVAPAGAGYAFINEAEDVVLVPDVAVLSPGFAYIVYFVPGTAFSGCLYNTSIDTLGAASTNSSGSDAESSNAASSGSDTDSGNSCFPADATVQLETGVTVAMSSLSIGDSVSVGVGIFSRVFGFTHMDPSAVCIFLTLSTASGAAIRLTPGHFIYSNGDLVPASAVAVGDSLELSSGEVSAITSITTGFATGLFNPQTLEGSIVVDGVRASTYTTTVEPAFAHAALTPVRSFFSVFGVAPLSLPLGTDSIPALLPDAFTSARAPIQGYAVHLFKLLRCASSIN